jgi:hypothetical protein
LNLWNRKSAHVRHSEEWFAALYRNMPLPESSDTGHCDGPDDIFLRKLASSTNKPSPFDPRVAHVASCPQCLRKVRSFREEAEKSRNRPAYLSIGAWTAALVLITLGLSLYLYRRPTAEQSAAVSQTLDLSDYGTTRGAPSPTPVVKLPRRVVEVTIILPRFSDPGSYSVNVLETKQASLSVAQGSGTAVQQGSKTLLTIDLDLHSAKPGLYYLSTTHGTDEAAYFYPLEVVR